MGIEQISVSQFAPAYPYGPPKSDLEMNLGAVKDFSSAMKEIQKQRYENQLLKFLLGLSQPPEGQGGQPGQPSLAELATGGQPPMPPQDSSILGANASPADLQEFYNRGGLPPGAPGGGMPPPPPQGVMPPPMSMPPQGMPPGMPPQGMPPGMPPQGGLASLAAPGGMPMPDIMRQRFEQPTREPGLMGLLKGVGGAFNPMGQYRGAPTQLESLILGERMKQMFPEQMTPYQRESIGIEREKMAREPKGLSVGDTEKQRILNIPADQRTPEEKKFIGTYITPSEASAASMLYKTAAEAVASVKPREGYEIVAELSDKGWKPTEKEKKAKDDKKPMVSYETAEEAVKAGTPVTGKKVVAKPASWGGWIWDYQDLPTPKGAAGDKEKVPSWGQEQSIASVKADLAKGRGTIWTVAGIPQPTSFGSYSAALDYLSKRNLDPKLFKTELDIYKGIDSARAKGMRVVRDTSGNVYSIKPNELKAYLKAGYEEITK